MWRNVGVQQMRSFLKRSRVWLGMVALAGAGTAVTAMTIPNLFPFLDSTGAMATFTSAGKFDESGPFFQSLGTNGRTCASCHVIGNAMGLSAAHAEAVYERTNGTDPLFAAVDGATCPTAAPGQALNFSLLRHNGLIRIGLQLPASLQFTITAVHDPYGCALVTDPVNGVQTVSVYRRPLPATNLGFLSAVMFDGRENVMPLNSPSTFAANLMTDLKHQSVDATTGHAQAPLPGPSDALQTQMVNFELALNSAQAFDFLARDLTSGGASGGPRFLSTVPFFPGINDSLGPPAQFTPNAFTIYSKWQYSSDAQRRSIARGEQIFNAHALTITNVRGLNDALNVAGNSRNMHNVPRYAKRWQPFVAGAARNRHEPHRELRNRFHDSGGGEPAVNAGSARVPDRVQSGPLQRPNHLHFRSRQGSTERVVRRCGKREGANPARTRSARAVLPQWCGGDAERGG